MQKRIARKLIWFSAIVLSTTVSLSQYYPTNVFVKSVVPTIGLLAFFTLVGSTIAANIRARSDKDNPEYAKAPPLPTLGMVIQKSFLYMILPGVALTVVFFIIALAFGWRPA